MDTDEECSVVLELSENDPFFNKKKILLQNKGFRPKERIYVRSSSKPGWMNATVKDLLQIARIVQLNELELYFAEDDGCTSVEFYSPRNELEALNSILSLTDISVSCCTHLHTNILQELRQTILDLISDFGNKNSVKGIVESDHSCDQEERLIKWAESNGARTQLNIAYVQGAGRGARAGEDLEVGDIALEIPVPIIISEELVHETDIYHVLKEVDGISSETILLLWSMKEKYNCDSKFKTYFDTLPEKFNTGLSFGIEAITMLDGTLLLEEIMQARQQFVPVTIKDAFKIQRAIEPELEITQKYTPQLNEGSFKEVPCCLTQIAGAAVIQSHNPDFKILKFINTGAGQIGNIPSISERNHLHAQYDELFPTLCNDFPNIFPPELYTWEKFLWACELWYSNSMKIMFPDGKLRTCLIPIAGFLNHSLYPHILHYGKVDTATNSLKFCLSRPCKSGEECCLSYGNFPSSHLITFYGFLPQGDNPYDVIPLDIDGSDVYSIEDIPLSNWTTHMVRGTWLSNNHSVFYYGLPSPLLDHLRRSRSPMLQTKTFLQENLENELVVLEDLIYIFDDVMDNIGEIDLDDRENCSWDVKLAMDFKNLQRRIACSVSTSCHTGFSTVKNELYKCMAEDILG